MLSHLLSPRLLAYGGFRCVQMASRNESTEIVIRNPESNLLVNQRGKFDAVVKELIAREGDSLKVEYDKALDPVIDPFSEECDQEFIDELCPPPEPTFNLAPLVNQSSTLQKLVDLGVSLFLLEQKRDMAEYIVRLDFDRDIKEHLLFLHRFGVPADKLGDLITRNPLIFNENIKNLKTRLKFLRSSGFTHKQLLKMFQTRSPEFINYSVDSMKNLFEFLKREYHLKSRDIPLVLSEIPRAFGIPDMTFRQLSFAIKEEAGFEKHEVRQIIVKAPKIFEKSRQKLITNYDYLSLEGGYSNMLIANEPQPMVQNFRKLHARIRYLKTLEMLQPDPKRPGFIPLRLLTCPHRDFLDALQLTMADFNSFLRSM